MKRRTRIAAGVIVGAPFLVAGLYLAFMTASDYRPPAELPLAIRDNRDARIEKGKPFSALTFNIGYCGMDAGADFFMDGGRGSGAGSREQARENLERIAAFLAGEKADLALLQEVDASASRSFRVDELAELRRRVAPSGSVFALNYKVPWVPVPLFKPMGAVRSGLLVFSRFNVRSALRRRLPGQEAWPRQLAELDRCAIELRLPLAGGGELVLIALHLSAFDRGGRIRRQQLDFLRGRLLAEYRAGRHVIAGGDWNHGLPGARGTTMPPPAWYVELPRDFTPPGFHWAIDPARPTVRSSATPYRPGQSFTAAIDGFLVSANVEVRSVVVRDLGFRNSDHNPVRLEFILH
jgi:endonuclease/exonuclease/phosphatase family metal-dependent hydrolase